ncbi:MAG TPA: NAD-dependent epimerase/dehydratase family protein, partial [Pirellulales bacterium]
MLTLVTGATGLVGNNVVRALVARGQQVRVLTRETSDPRPLAGLDIERCHGDVRDREAVLRACRGVERIVHA